MFSYASLLFVSMSINKVLTEENNVLKISDELKATLSKLSPNDTLLLWLDVYIAPLPDGNVYLSSSDVSPITDVGARIAGVAFSPDKQLLWYLVETCNEEVSSLASLSIVRKASLASIDAWDWWDKSWRNETPVDPLLNLMMQRVDRNSLISKVPVVINYANVERNDTKVDKREIIGEITAFTESLDGEVVRTGLAEYIIADLPATALSSLSENDYIRTLEPSKPLYLRGGSFGQLESNIQGQLPILLLSLGVVCCFFREPRKAKLIFMVSLLATGFLFLHIVSPAYSLDVSRPTIEADSTGYTGNGVVVAVIDSGIDFDHGFLAPAILGAYDLTGGSDPMDYEGHGTHVAGIVASRCGLFTGVAPQSQIISLKIDDVPSAQDAIQWCIDNRIMFNIRVIQLSWGELLEQPGDGTDPFSMKADKAVEAGISVVVAVNNQDWNANGNYELGNPEQAFNVVAVGAANDQNSESIDDDTVAYYSSGISTTDGRPKPDVLAPGDHTDGTPLVGIWSTRSSQASSDEYEAVAGVYGRLSGTSMAAPHVSGTIALMLEANPNLTPAQVKAILRQTARLNTILNGDPYAGHGIIDAYAAVQLAPNVDGIFLSEMYDPFSVKTLEHRIDDWSADYLTFDVDPPVLWRGFSISSVNCHYGRFGIWTSHTLLSNLRAPFVWIDGAFHNLGYNLNEYLFSGPRIFALGDGFVWLRALFKVNGVMVKYESRMGVEGMGMGFFITISGASSQKTLISINPEIWDPSNFPQLRSTNEIIYYERKVTGNTDLNISDLAHAEYLEIDQIDMDAVWIIRGDYTGNNPDSALNDEYTYNRDILVCYQGTSSNNVVWIYREPDGLPAPNPPPTKPATPDGPDGYSRQTLSYTTSSSSSGNTIHYEFDWGDGSRTWTDWYASDATATAEHSWTYSGTYYVKVRAEDSNNAWSDWSESLTVTLSGMGCPTLFVWNGTDFIVDNNLLPKSARSNGTEVEDYYRLEQDLVPFYGGYFNSYYSLLISEFQQEHSYLDEVQLFAVDHPANVSVAVSPTGEILTYQNPYAPSSAVDEANVSWLDEISSIDSDYYESCNGSFLVLNFGDINSSFAKFIVRADPPPDGPPTKKSIHIQVLNASESWVDVVSIIPRAYWATDIIDLLDYLPAEGELIVRLYFTDNHRVDFVGLDTTPQAEIDVKDVNLLLASHSSEVAVTAELRSDDDVYAELVPDQQITLLFSAGKPDGEARTFIFCIKGYYYTITG